MSTITGSPYDHLRRHLLHGGEWIMDRITSGFLSEFAATHELTHLPEPQQFEHFATFVALGKHYDGPAFDTDDVVVGRGDDAGIDGIAILVNGSIVTDVEELAEHAELSADFDVTFLFVQATTSASFDASKIGDFGFGVKDFFAEVPTIPRNDEVKNAAEVMDALYDNHSRRLRPGNPSCRLYYVTTGSWNEDANPEARRKQIADDLRALNIFRDVEVTCVGADLLQRLYRQTKNAVSREFTFANRTPLPDIDGVTEAFIGFLPFSQFKNLVTDESGELLRSIFYENVRDWQDYSAPVNNEIKNTVLSNHKDRFVLMNNGVTIIARALTRGRRDQVTLDDFQIVNGCQTTHVLLDQRAHASDNLMIPLKVIATADEEIIRDIIRATNRQTKVEEDQFFALTEFADQLESYFQTMPEARRLYYERRSGQFSTGSVPSTRIVTFRNLVRAAAAMYLDMPHQATRNYQAIREKVGEAIFAKGHKLEPYYSAASAWYRTEANFRAGRIDTKLKPGRFHILLAMRWLAYPRPLPYLNSRQMEASGNAMTDVFWGAQADDLCVRAAGFVRDAADGDLTRDNIRTEKVTERIIGRCKEEAGIIQ